MRRAIALGFLIRLISVIVLVPDQSEIPPATLRIQVVLRQCLAGGSIRRK
jgi:hypothetical protein